MLPAKPASSSGRTPALAYASIVEAMLDADVPALNSSRAVCARSCWMNGSSYDSAEPATTPIWNDDVGGGGGGGDAGYAIDRGEDQALPSTSVRTL